MVERYKWECNCILYLSSMIETCRLPSSSRPRRCCGRRTCHPAVIHGPYYDCTDHSDSVFNDVVNPPTVPSSSALHHLDVLEYNLPCILTMSVRAYAQAGPEHSTLKCWLQN